MVVWTRVPCRLSYFAYSVHSFPRIVVRNSHQGSVISTATRDIQISREATTIPDHSPSSFRNLQDEYAEPERGHEVEGNKDSLSHKNLSHASHTSNHRPIIASQHDPKPLNSSVVSPDNGSNSGTTQSTGKDTSSRLSEEIRIAMREVAYPVAVVTSSLTVKEAGDIKETSLRGLLVSSFNTVTLDPEPYISFNVKLPSRTWDTIMDTKEFMVHVMWSADTAHKFASNPSPVALIGESAAILEELREGRIFGFRCKLATHHKVADHMIVIGKVLEIMPQSFASRNTFRHESLLWKKGKWHIAQPIDDDT